jgi:hypothetical protein
VSESCFAMSTDVPMTPVPNPEEERRQKALKDYRKKLLDHREREAEVRKLRTEIRDKNKEYDRWFRNLYSVWLWLKCCRKLIEI